MARIAIVVGTRPEIIKIAPVIRALKRDDFSLIHTGQHYDYNLSLQFIKELGLPKPDVSLVLRNSVPALQVGEMVAKLHKVFNRLRPQIVAVVGDTNSVLAAGMAALKNKIKLAHVEAGVRSYDWSTQEEQNRVVVDHISDLLFAPARSAKANLLKEDVHGAIHVTGNTVIDAVMQNMPIASRRSTVRVPRHDFALVTIHRAENVDDRRTLKNLVSALVRAQVRIIFPIHPHTVKRLKQFKLYDKLRNADNVKLISPVGYFGFLALMKRCRLIVTDSGGIQQEVTCPLLRKRVVLLRDVTETPESVEAGFVRIAGRKEADIIREIRRAMGSSGKLSRSSPFGNGDAGRKIARLLLSSCR